MDFEDLMGITDSEIEYGICCIAERFGMDVTPANPNPHSRHKAMIREDLTKEFHGCFPYHYGDDETPCYLAECDYGCKHCPMRDLYAGSGQYNPKSYKVEDMVAALIKAIKMDDDYEPTETEIKTAIEIIRG